MSNARIGYHNLLTEAGATVTVSSEAVGFEKENAYDGFGYDWWKPDTVESHWIKASFASPVTCDYYAFWGHDYDDAQVLHFMEYSDDDAIWTQIGGADIQGDKSTTLRTFTQESHRYWRLTIISLNSSLPSVAGIQFGNVMVTEYGMPSGFSPSSIAPMTELKTSRSESGAFIGGRVKNKGVEGTIILNALSPAWVRSDWKPFLEHVAAPAVFVFAWDIVNYPDETVLAWAKDAGKIPKPSYSSNLFMSATLPFEGTL